MSLVPKSEDKKIALEKLGQLIFKKQIKSLKQKNKEIII